MSRWATAEHALAYLARADRIPHRTEGEAELLRQLAQAPRSPQRVLDLGTGDGRLLHLIQLQFPTITGVALDFSAPMLAAVRQRFGADDTLTVVAHDLRQPLPDLGSFDAIVSSFAIHHLPDDRKRSLYQEISDRLNPGGRFCNLEHVASPSPRLHAQFLAAIGYTPAEEDPENHLVAVETQLNWLRGVGLVDVDCHWKWLEMALLMGIKPEGAV